MLDLTHIASTTAAPLQAGHGRQPTTIGAYSLHSVMGEAREKESTLLHDTCTCTVYGQMAETCHTH